MKMPAFMVPANIRDAVLRFLERKAPDIYHLAVEIRRRLHANSRKVKVDRELLDRPHTDGFEAFPTAILMFGIIALIAGLYMLVTING